MVTGPTVARAFLAFVATVLLTFAGIQMVGIESSADFTTVDEVFYNAVGWAMFGFAAFALAYAFSD